MFGLEKKYWEVLKIFIEKKKELIIITQKSPQAKTTINFFLAIILSINYTHYYKCYEEVKTIYKYF